MPREDGSLSRIRGGFPTQVIEHIMALVPSNEVIEQALNVETPMFPEDRCPGTRGECVDSPRFLA